MGTCIALNARGRACRAAALRGRPFCRMHDPEMAEAVAEARRLGGLRRRRETTLAQTYDLSGLGSPEEILRLLDIAAFDALGLENSVARVRTLVQISGTAIRLLEVTSLDDRLRALEESRPRENGGTA